MTRPYYCWSVSLTFRCGCVEMTPTTHACGPHRNGCSRWILNRRSERVCNQHRSAEWGLSSATTTTTTSFDSPPPPLSSLPPSSSLSPSPGTPSQEWAAYGTGETAAMRTRRTTTTTTEEEEAGPTSESGASSLRRVELKEGGMEGEGSWEGYYYSSQRRTV